MEIQSRFPHCMQTMFDLIMIILMRRKLSSLPSCLARISSRPIRGGVKNEFYRIPLCSIHRYLSQCLLGDTKDPCQTCMDSILQQCVLCGLGLALSAADLVHNLGGLGACDRDGRPSF